MLRFSSFLVLTLTLICGAPLYSKEIYVNNTTGHDRNLGRSADTVDSLIGPVKTIARAIELSGPGDKIIIAPTGVPYRETLCLFGKKQSGDDFGAFTIEGNGAVLDGSEMLPIEVWSHAFGNTFRFRPTKFTHFQLFESGRPLKRVTVETGSKQPPPLNPMEWCVCNGFAYLCLDNFKRPDDREYKFSYSNLMTGITIMQTNDLRINDLIVQGFQVDGISVVNNTKNVVLDNIIVRGNGRNGLTIGAASTVSLGYSLLGDNRAAQIEMGERSELLFFLSELQGVDENDLPPVVTRTAQSIAIANNNRGTIRQVGPEGVAPSEATGKPDIANLWGKLVVAVPSDQSATTAPTTLTSVSTSSVDKQSSGDQISEQPPGTEPKDTNAMTAAPVGETAPSQNTTSDDEGLVFEWEDELTDDKPSGGKSETKTDDPPSAESSDGDSSDDGDDFDWGDSPFGET